MQYRVQFLDRSDNVIREVRADARSARTVLFHRGINRACPPHGVRARASGAAKEVLGFRGLTVVADAGYSNGAAAPACEADGITACAPANRSVNSQGDGSMFDRSAFVYQPEADVCVCPAGRTLARKQMMRRDSLILYAASDCTGCSLKPRCTTAKRRFVTRHLHEDALERMNARVKADPSLMKQRRRCAAEHPFGTMKRMTAGGRFLTRGLKKVAGEAALSVLAYNINRAINLAGAETLRARLA